MSARLDRSVRLINSGVGGYNTVQEVTYFKQAGLHHQPDLVILTYAENDIEVNEGPFDPWATAALKGKSLAKLAQTLLGKLWLYRLADHTYRYAIFTGVEQKPGGPAAGDRGWDASISALVELVALCDERRIPLIIFFFRWQPGASQPLFKEVVLQAKDHPVRDIRPWFPEGDIHSLMVSKVDSHPNVEAHRLMAERMAEEIAVYLAQRIPSRQSSEESSVVITTR